MEPAQLSIPLGDGFDEVPRGIPCPTCGYDLGGLPARVCPECGHRFRLEIVETPTPRDWGRFRLERLLQIPAAVVGLIVAMQCGTADRLASAPLISGYLRDVFFVSVCGMLCLPGRRPRTPVALMTACTVVLVLWMLWTMPGLIGPHADHSGSINMQAVILGGVLARWLYVRMQSWTGRWLLVVVGVPLLVAAGLLILPIRIELAATGHWSRWNYESAHSRATWDVTRMFVGPEFRSMTRSAFLTFGGSVVLACVGVVPAIVAIDRFMIRCRRARRAKLRANKKAALNSSAWVEA